MYVDILVLDFRSSYLTTLTHPPTPIFSLPPSLTLLATPNLYPTPSTPGRHTAPSLIILSHHSPQQSCVPTSPRSSPSGSASTAASPTRPRRRTRASIPRTRDRPTHSGRAWKTSWDPSAARLSSTRGEFLVVRQPISK